MYDETVRAQAVELAGVGKSLSAISRHLQVSRSTLRGWLADPRGPAGGARPCPDPAEPTRAYAALFGFYLGDGCISQHPRTYAMRIACDRTLPGIVSDVRTLLNTVHPERPTHLVHAPGVIVVQQYWKHWPCLFPQHGAGRKHERELGMTDWQWAIVEQHPADFLRGLFHSDGCRTNNWATRMVRGEKRRYDYPRWQFTNMSEEILTWCGHALDVLGLAWRRSSKRTISVSRRNDVARLDELIGLKS